MQQDRRAYRVMLAEYLREQARWREEKAAEYPDDVRNARCSLTLGVLAEYVEQLPDDDENLRVLEAVQQPYAVDVFTPGEEAARMISRFGFDRVEPEEGFEEFLARLGSADVGGALEQEHEAAGDDQA